MTNQDLAQMILEGEIDPAIVLNGGDPEKENDIRSRIFKCLVCSRWKKVTDRINDLFDSDICTQCERNSSLTPKEAAQRLIKEVVNQFLPCIEDYAVDQGYTKEAVDLALKEITQCSKCALWCYQKDLKGFEWECSECFYSADETMPLEEDL